ncbi:hypothetical protein ACJIZ3_013688 [Penstemon smallii]|uniref:Uncharacterized protein n=1 Tax=Penstemon smallii TaxID=265156 RepID=A0ABD3RHC3_9LAMI
MTQRELNGKKKPNLSAKTMCKVDHLQNLALWAVEEASIPSLGSFFGQRLAATTEALGVRTDPSLFLCQRCESILQPGQNCTVRIEKNKPKQRHKRKKSNISAQNSLVYSCHYCSHRNLMRGTPKGYVKEICPPKAKSLPVKLNLAAKSVVEKHTIAEVSTIALKHNPETSLPETPLPKNGLTLLDSKRRKRNRSIAKKVPDPESTSTAVDAEKNTIGASSKRRRKSWTSLKEIAQSSVKDTSKNFANLTIPFLI